MTDTRPSHSNRPPILQIFSSGRDSYKLSARCRRWQNNQRYLGRGKSQPAENWHDMTGIPTLTLDRDAQKRSLTNRPNKSKGHSKIERQIRVSTHCTHVLFLLFHNLIRNGWPCDREFKTFWSAISQPVWRERFEDGGRHLESIPNRIHFHRKMESNGERRQATKISREIWGFLRG